MKKTFILAFVLTCTVMAEQSALEKFNALVIQTHKDSDESFVNIQDKTLIKLKKKLVLDTMPNMYTRLDFPKLHKLLWLTKS